MGSNRKKAVAEVAGRRRWCAALAALGAGLLPGCGDLGGDDGGRLDVRTELLPLVLGASWTYRVTDAGSGLSEEKTQRIAGTRALAEVAGEVFELVTDRAGERRTITLQQRTAAGVVRYLEETYDRDRLVQREVYSPYKLRVPADIGEPGARVTQTYRDATYDGSGVLSSESKKTELWTFEAVEPVTPPFGRFERAVRIRRVSASSDKTFWFVEGVGKVKEVGAGQTEELVSYELP